MPINRDLVTTIMRSRWYVPVCCVALGALLLVALAAGGNAGDGVKSFAVMAAVGAVFAVGGERSETLRGLGGPGRDERWEAIDQRATATAGAVLGAVIIGAWLWEVGHGRDGSTFAWLAAVGGIAYLAGAARGRFRG